MTQNSSTDALVLGPLVRYVDTTSATIWVETRETATVDVHAAGRAWRARTFAAHGHHYALVEVDGLHTGSKQAYTVSVNGTTVWPDPASEYPPSVIATLEPGKRLRMAFGSCRTSVPHDEQGNRSHGVDALRAYALHMVDSERSDRIEHWPDLVLFLGDQVYADETTDEMREFIESRRSLDEPPGAELKDFEEYAHLYRLAWSDRANRWLLSTLPSLMIFDDHDVRDDWNTSLAWKQEMEETSWWHQRIVSALGSYWVYQHLGNMSPAERGRDPLWQAVLAGRDSDQEVDLSEALDEFAARVDAEPDSYRWSYSRDIDDVRLVVLDSRAARVLEPAGRSMLDPEEMRWLDKQMQGGFRHLLVGTSLPFLLSPGLHHLEAWNEALVGGAWGRTGARMGEALRQTVDLEHWAAFQSGFAEVAQMALEVARGERGPAPETVTFLSGDVHHSYVSEVRDVVGPRQDGEDAAGDGGTSDDGDRSTSRIVQAVCSPIRNPLPRALRFMTAFSSYGLAGPMGALAARSAKVPDPPFTWGLVKGPWFDNNLAVLEDQGEQGLAMCWYTGVVADGDHAHPRLDEVASVLIGPDVAGTPRGLTQRVVAGAKARVGSDVVPRVRSRLEDRVSRVSRSRSRR